MGFYENIRDGAAANALDEFGVTVSIKRKVLGDYRTEIGEAAETIQNFSGTLLLTNFESSEVDGESIKHTDIKALAKATESGWEPKQHDEVTLDGDKLFVVNVWPLSPGGVAVLYEIQLRK